VTAIGRVAGVQCMMIANDATFKGMQGRTVL
jgi:acetyl-CoA carboxylase carboxyltransferase component